MGVNLLPFDSQLTPTRPTRSATVLDLPLVGPFQGEVFCYGRRAIKSISTRAPLASPVTPMQVRAGRLLGGKYEA